MKPISKIIWKALGLAVLTEVLFIGGLFLFSGFGPCGATDLYGGLFMLVHAQGFGVAAKLNNEDLALFFGILIPVLEFTLVYIAAILLWKKFKAEKSR